MTKWLVAVALLIAGLIAGYFLGHRGQIQDLTTGPIQVPSSRNFSFALVDDNADAAGVQWIIDLKSATQTAQFTCQKGTTDTHPLPAGNWTVTNVRRVVNGVTDNFTPDTGNLVQLNSGGQQYFLVVVRAPAPSTARFITPVGLTSN